jgi:long-subunit fatty acid transport protein
MRNIKINPNFPTFGPQFDGSMVSAPEFFTAGATKFAPLSSAANALVTGLSSIPAGTPLTSLPSTTQTQIATVLGAAGLSSANMNVGTAVAALTGVGAKSAELSRYAAMTQGLEVDAEQTGMAFTPILSFNYSPIENLNIAVKYEFKTNLELKTKVNDGKSGGGIYIQDSISKANLPAILFIGTEYKPFEKLMLSGSFNYYWDKNVDYDGQDDVSVNMIDNNFLEFGLGAEYALTEKLRISAGWLATVTGVNEKYQNDITYSANTNSFGFGFGYRINKMIDINVGGQYTDYATATRSFTRLAPINETLDKKTMILGIGADFFFGK